MAASLYLPDSRKRPRPSLCFSPQNFCLDFTNGVLPSCNKRRGKEIILQHHVSPLLSSSSCEQPPFISSISATPLPDEDIGSSFPRSHEFSVPASSSASALSDTADSTTGSPFLSVLQHKGNSTVHEWLGCVSCDQEAESCCEGNGTSELDVTSFLLHEVWEDASSDGGDGIAFNPETVFLNGGASADCSAFAECSAENGNWFLNDLESEGHDFLNEVLDQEWMAAAVENLDRINDTLDADLCVLHLLEPDHADKNYELLDEASSM